MSMKSSPACAGCRELTTERRRKPERQREKLMNPFANIGRATLTVLAHIGRLAQFTGQALAGVVSPPIYTRLILAQMVRIGYFSLPVVGLTAFFTRGVLALQIYLGANRF